MGEKKQVLITGAAGFIGFHLSRRLLDAGYDVVGVDNLNEYYDVQLKKDRLALLDNPAFHFYKVDIANKEELQQIFTTHKTEYVVNLAAQAGVRYSIENPYAYLHSNITGFLNIIECCRHHEIKHLVYASSSSVYGANETMPFRVEDNVDHPISLYAASKKSNELIAHTYSSLFQLPTTGLRFFTVYGPWGRPDMALFLFTKAILSGETIDIYNNGNHSRDFTYVDDVVESISRLIPKPAEKDASWTGKSPNPATSFSPYRLFNIGNNSPVELMDFIGELEKQIGKEAIKNFLPMQPGDVQSTYADTSALNDYVNFKPETPVSHGISEFVRWYKEYYRL